MTIKTKMENNQNQEMPAIIVGGKGVGNYTDSKNIPVGMHRGIITSVTSVIPNDQSTYKNYQFKMIIEFPQFAEEDKTAPGLFYNVSVLCPPKETPKDALIKDIEYRSTLFVGSASKFANLLESINYKIEEGKTIDKECLLNQEVGCTVIPHTNLKNEKTRKIDKIFEASELGGESVVKKVEETKEEKSSEPSLKEKCSSLEQQVSDGKITPDEYAAKIKEFTGDKK